MRPCQRGIYSLGGPHEGTVGEGRLCCHPPHVIATQLAAVQPQSAGQAHRWPTAIGQPLLRQCGQSISLTAKGIHERKTITLLKTTSSIDLDLIINYTADLGDVRSHIHIRTLNTLAHVARTTHAPSATPTTRDGGSRHPCRPSPATLGGTSADLKRSNGAGFGMPSSMRRRAPPAAHFSYFTTPCNDTLRAPRTS